MVQSRRYLLFEDVNGEKTIARASFESINDSVLEGETTALAVCMAGPAGYEHGNILGLVG